MTDKEIAKEWDEIRSQESLETTSKRTEASFRKRTIADINRTVRVHGAYICETPTGLHIQTEMIND